MVIIGGHLVLAAGGEGGGGLGGFSFLGGGRGRLFGLESAVVVQHLGQFGGVGDKAVGDFLHFLQGCLVFL